MPSRQDTPPHGPDPRLQLLLRPSCLLCLEAEHVLHLAGVATFERIDVERAPDLEARYGQRIPVLRLDEADLELDWPFDASEIAALLGGAVQEPQRRS